ncbi:hypothetical protein TNCV_343281 [Trichonephila clavipes]|nr:hypothetical protein TNCV_343281 [Trichonephila clavipes]
MSRSGGQSEVRLLESSSKPYSPLSTNCMTSPICVLCDTGQDMTAAHLDVCSALNDLNCIVKRFLQNHGPERSRIPESKLLQQRERKI